MVSWRRHLTLWREPDEEIGEPGALYLRRWWVLPKNRFLNVYIHNFLRSDEERALHNHPWLWNISLIIRGSYIEHMPGGESKLRKSFRPVFRLGHTPHRVQLLPASDGKSGVRAVWTLFIIGPKVRDWGFFCPKGWVHNEEFNTPTEHGTKVGRGCD